MASLWVLCCFYSYSNAYDQQYYVGDTGPNGGTVISVSLDSILSDITVEYTGDFEDTTYTYVYTETVVEEVQTTETSTVTTYEIVSTETSNNMLLNSLPDSSSGIVLDHTYNNSSSTGHIHTDYQGGSITYEEDLTNYLDVEEFNQGFTLYGNADVYACTNQIGGDCSSGRLDTFTITLKVIDPTTGEDYMRTTSFSVGYNWNNYETSLTVPSNTLGSDTLALATFYGRDNGGWAGWYGPVVNNMEMYAVYNQLQEVITQVTNIITQQIESTINTTEYQVESVYIPPVFDTVSFDIEIQTEFDSFDMNIEVDTSSMNMEISSMDTMGDMEMQSLDMEMDMELDMPEMEEMEVDMPEMEMSEQEAEVEVASNDSEQEEESEEESSEEEQDKKEDNKKTTSESTKQKIAQVIMAKVMETADSIAINNTKLAVMASLADTEGFNKYQAKELQDTELYISEIMYDSKQLDDPYAKPYSLAQDYIMEQMIDSQYGRN